ncbi:DUF1697 domain-containing protein [Brumimicrobium oceani]|uniref:DUF1697 domain-containing protein n=1 Tax=Brumimicrobium oceani TaxID=2100725 RepID=A0A2U2XED9_9FLAO|nr:DUF1697 domain-containing protein [Brumimicrobium oceani]PWH86176.1 DUF1697 domain-containing protein [Brumimicrobium oceani]
MEKKIAILRGINVGGKRKILMTDLKSMLVEIGIMNAKTYIQSGNVIFESELKNLELSLQIESEILKKFGFDVPVIIKTRAELKAAISSNPFFTSDADMSKLHLTFLNKKPSEKDIESLRSFDSKEDQFEIQGENIFIFCEGKYHQSKLTNNFFEKKLKVGATTRNWKTVLKLMELSQD